MYMHACVCVYLQLSIQFDLCLLRSPVTCNQLKTYLHKIYLSQNSFVFNNPAIFFSLGFLVLHYFVY
ncbi:hypothetical protein WN944_025539 [Citrus x changshan-huyou]|uniref:Uncharacterized protein n=1 Tax=Citrus x changshan-huyou TaxID=2935761 RepID=A0AAP0LUM0_9ROSI